MKTKSFINRYVTFPINVYSKGIYPSLFLETMSLDHCTRENLINIQNTKLKRLLQYAANHCEYYRQCVSKYEIDLCSNDLLDELKKWPILTKDLIRKNYPAITSDDRSKFKRVREIATGGSTGKPIRVLIDKLDYNMGYLAQKRQYERIGWKGGDSVHRLWGASIDIGGQFVETLKWLLLNERTTNVFAFKTADYQKTLVRLRKKPADYLMGYKSALIELVNCIEESGQPLAAVKSVMVCAEPFFSWERVRMEHWLGCKVYAQYGSREIGAIGCECKQQEGYHLNEDNVFVEILDDNDQPTTTGNITVTKLNNYLMPLIRYQIGDIGTLEQYHCRCGLPSRRLMSVDGRKASMVLLKNGKKIPTLFFPHTFKDYPWIIQYQIEQVERNFIKIYFKRKEEMWSKNSEDQLTCTVKKYLGTNMSIRYQYVENFTKVPTGKHEFFVSKITH